MEQGIETFYTNGNPREKCTYVNGRLEGLYQCWHSNGQKLEECTYVNGVQEGFYQHWHSNGQKAQECNYVNGKIEGLYQYWHENGQKAIECTYVNDVQEGLYQSWYENGDINEIYLRVDGIKRDFQDLANEHCKKLKEELMIYVNHPDRMERIAKHYGLKVIEYVEMID